MQIVSTRFYSAGRQAVEARQLLPVPSSARPDRLPPRVSPQALIEEESGATGAEAGVGEYGSPPEARLGYFEFEPDIEQLLERLIPLYSEASIYGALLEASASEHTARQRAMSAATENAEELIKTLRRVMNRARQDSITTEIMEIVGGAEALRSAVRRAPRPHSSASNRGADRMTALAPEVTEASQLENGRIVAIAGPVFDVEFPPHALPEINTAVQVKLVVDDQEILITAEVAQQIGEGRVRCVALKPTDGLARGATVINTGHGISVPVGDAVLGHVFNVIGETLDAGQMDEPDDVVGDPPPGAGVRHPRAEAADVRDRDQGHRPA